MIRVLLVDDSPLALQILQRLLAGAPDIEVVGTAGNGREALVRVAALDPDVICLDLHMPVMDGLAFTQAVMAERPRPILVVSVSVAAGGSGVFRLLEAGAVDVLPKPRDFQTADARLGAELVRKIRIVAGVRVLRHGVRTPGEATPPPLVPHAPPRLVVVGASTGGPQALHAILAALPADFALPMVCVQHIGSEFLAEMVGWLDAATPLRLALARGGERPVAGRVYFAPGGGHLEFDARGTLVLTDGPPCDGHRPSVSVSMRAAAQHFGAGAVGVLLSGMGRDGAEGMASIARAGGVTIAQDEASCVIYGMPAAAVALGAVQHVLPLARIVPALTRLADAGEKRGGMV